MSSSQHDFISNSTLLFKGDNTLIYYDLDDSGEPRIIKTSIGPEHGFRRASRLMNEHQILTENFPEFHSQIIREAGGNTYLVRRSVEGIDLQQWLNNHHDIRTRLQVFIGIARSLEAVHARNVIHRDISPTNIIVGSQLDCSIIDFDLSSVIDAQAGVNRSDEHIEGSLRYISPEQTGRINRMVDFRTDLYSLGATAYQLFTGKPPFAGDTAAELVHAHIARMPERASDLNGEIPAALAEIIHCLLSKDPEDRYQSARGLLHDLDLCLERMDQGVTEPFVLKRCDIFSTLHIVENLYGREQDLKRLKYAAEEMLQSNARLALISGHSGVGKTSFVNELMVKFSHHDYIYLSGKFESLNRHIPYSAWISVCNDLLLYLMARPASEIKEVKNMLKLALGDQAGVLISVIPRLSQLLGDLPPIPHAGGQESQNRFIFQAVTFVKTMASIKPLLIFLDDLQWADSASIELLKRIFEGCYASKLMVICAYREEEVSDTDPFLVRVKELELELGIRPLRIRLGSLSEPDVSAMISDTFNAVDRSDALASLVHGRTQGNSFAVKQFLHRIFAEKLITFDLTEECWKWSSEKVSQLILSNDIADILSHKIRELSESAADIIRIASCIGAEFDLSTLSRVSDCDRAEVLSALMDASKSGLVAPKDFQYRYLPALLEDEAYNPQFYFCHDRIQQTAYDGLNTDFKKTVHSRVAALLSESLIGEDRKERLFELVNHLNKGNQPITDAERQYLRTLNYEAGLRALMSVANSQAVEFLTTARRLLPEHAHQVNYREWLSIVEKLAEAASFAGNTGLMEEHCAEIAVHAASVTDKIKTYETRIAHYFNNTQHSKAAEIAIEALTLLGLRFPSKVSKLTVILEVIKTKMALTSGKISRIDSFSHMTDEAQLQLMRIARAALPALLSARTELYPLLICDMVRRSVKHGNCAPSIAAYGSYSIVVAGILGEIDNGTIIARKSKELVAQFHEPVYIATSEFIYNFFILHWTLPLRQALSGLNHGYVSGMLAGNIQEGVYCFYIKQFFEYCLDAKLKEVENGFTRVVELCRQYHQRSLQRYAEMYQTSVRMLMNGNDGSDDSQLGDFDLADYIRHCEQNKDSIGLGAVYLEWAFREALLGQYEAARSWIDHFQAIRETMNGTTLTATFAFVQSVVLNMEGGIHSAKSGADLKILKSNLKLYKKWSGFAPTNYQHRYQLMLALNNWRLKKIGAAEKYFDLAMESAVDSEMIRETAWIHELSSIFYASHGNVSRAETLKNQSWMYYSSWGASAKAGQLSGETADISMAVPSLSSSAGTSGSQLDLETILRSARTISSEIVLDNLIEKMLRLLAENAGARKGYFIYRKGNEWIVNDRIGFDEEIRFSPVKLDQADFLPLSIVRYAINSQENIIINEPADLHRFRQDPFFDRHASKSMLCMPFAHQGVINSVIFLENDLAYESFTQSRMRVLNLLSGQIAVSVGNAQLYASLEEKVQERTAELNAEKAKSEDLLLNILPEYVADELKQTGKSRARKFEEAAVLFSDFVNFTTVAEKMDPEELVAALSNYYEAFDQVVGKLGVEKIKTVGDSYLCVAGVPLPVKNPSELMVNTAIEFIRVTEKINQERRSSGMPVFEVRVGINTGPVVAGVVGSKKFAYDIWGDTVNTAARMEQSSSAGRINISGATYEKVKDIFRFEHRGKIHAKNKGEIDMYYIALNAGQAK